MDKKTLCYDIGGSGIKAIILDFDGKPITEKLRADTPIPAKIEPVIDIMVDLAKKLGEFDRVSVGFPGVVLRSSITTTAHNLDPSWLNYNLGEALSMRLNNVPVKVCNDADIQGLGVVEGKGVELVLTLGTGLGSALFVEGRLVPNLEAAHHSGPSGPLTYEELLGRAGLKKYGINKWNKLLQKVITQMENLFNYDILYLGGGEAKHVKVEDLPKNVKLVSNMAGLLGGIALWNSKNESINTNNNTPKAKL